MADQPLTLAVFEEFERRLFAIAGQFDRVARRFDTTDRRFDQLDARIDARFDHATGQIDAVLHRLLALEDEVTAIKEGLAG
ncbi:MAG: hypothetical protein DMF77_05255 [Acidobacteria bacterium]|nr:MAG: hypothetical protein DMF77_05255 [Acidobacteriota bacterium]